MIHAPGPGVPGHRLIRGVEVRAHACIVARVDDGRIRRLDEYLDAAAIAALT